MESEIIGPLVVPILIVLAVVVAVVLAVLLIVALVVSVMLGTAGVVFISERGDRRKRLAREAEPEESW